MRTLEETIAILEEKQEIDVRSDALFHLKEYKAKLDTDETELKKAYNRGYNRGQSDAHRDDEVERNWEESFRASQMPWNHYCEMGG